MLSLTVSQRIASRQSGFNRRVVVFCPRSNKRANVLKVKCQQEVAEVQAVAEEDVPVQVTGEEKQTQSTQTGKAQTLSESQFEDMGPSQLLDFLTKESDKINVDLIPVAAGALRRLTAEYRRQKIQNAGELLVSVQALKDCYKIMTRLLRKNMDSLDISGVSNVVWCLSVGINALQMHTEIEHYENVLQNLFMQSSILVSERKQKVSSQKLLRIMSFWVDYLDEDNRKYFDVLFERVLRLGLQRFERSQCIDFIKILQAINCTDLEVLDKYIGYMCRRYFVDRNQIFISVFCSATAKLRYYRKAVISKISGYPQTDVEYTNGGVVVSLAEYVATLAQNSDDREELARKIAQLTIEKAEYYRISDIVAILYYTASAHCPEQEYQQLVSKFLEIVGNDYGRISEDNLRKLRQAQLLQNSCGVSIELPQELQAMCVDAQTAYISGLVNDVEQDNYMLDVLQTIQQQFQDAQLAVTVLDGEALIPILVENDEYKVAIQPVTHKEFVLNAPNRLLESKNAENGIVQALGYLIQTVSSQKWYQDDNYKENVMNELSQRLNGTFVEGEKDVATEEESDDQQPEEDESNEEQAIAE